MTPNRHFNDIVEVPVFLYNKVNKKRIKVGAKADLYSLPRC